jgi:hypothetical protein
MRGRKPGRPGTAISSARNQSTEPNNVGAIERAGGRAKGVVNGVPGGVFLAFAKVAMENSMRNGVGDLDGGGPSSEAGWGLTLANAV